MESPKHLVRAAARSRLVHFALLGVLMFALAPRQRDPRTVRLGADQVRAIWASEVKRQSAGALTAAEKKAVLANFIDDELLYREGVRLGMAEDDRIVRNRVVQKMLFYSENLAGASATAPEATLRAFYAETPERWQAPAAIRFEQVFIPRALAGDAGAARAEGLQKLLAADPNIDRAKLTGLIEDVGVLDVRDEWSAQAALGRDFGPDLAKALFAQPAGTWGRVLTSPMGWHVARVEARKEGALRPFEEVRAEVGLAYGFAAKDKAAADTIARLRREYQLEVELPEEDAAAAAPTDAPRFSESRASAVRAGGAE